LATTELQTQIYDFCIGLLGPQGILDGSDGISGVPTDGHSASLQEAFLWARALTIAGGTSEVLRNIVGERLLGLPAESRVDTDRPWSAVRR
jgi:alkylation response protein AidB-like acyl-CoA dehydrogenase